MINYKYGECPIEQIQNLKTQMRKRIFFLLLCVDKDTKEKYRNIDVVSAIENLIVEFNGLNEIGLFRLNTKSNPRVVLIFLGLISPVVYM